MGIDFEAFCSSKSSSKTTVKACLAPVLFLVPFGVAEDHQFLLVPGIPEVTLLTPTPLVPVGRNKDRRVSLFINESFLIRGRFQAVWAVVWRGGLTLVQRCGFPFPTPPPFATLFKNHRTHAPGSLRGQVLWLGIQQLRDKGALDKASPPPAFTTTWSWFQRYWEASDPSSTIFPCCHHQVKDGDGQGCWSTIRQDD